MNCPSIKVVIDIFDIEKNKNIVLETIDNHINNPELEGLQLALAVVTYDNFDKVDYSNKLHLLSIEIEIELLGNYVINRLNSKDYGFYMDTEYQTEGVNYGLCKLLVYF